MKKKYVYYTPNHTELLTRQHVLEHLRLNPSDSVYNMAKEFGKNPQGIYGICKRLERSGFAKRKKLPVKNHMTYFWFLTEYAFKYMRKHGLRSWMEKKNPMFRKTERIANKYKNPIRMKVMGKVKDVAPKELVGFY